MTLSEIMAAISQIVYLPESRYRHSKMEKNCAVMTKSHDRAEFVRDRAGTISVITLSRIFCGRFDCGVRSLTRCDGVGHLRIHSFILTTFTAIGNDENHGSILFHSRFPFLSGRRPSISERDCGSCEWGQ